MNPPNGGRFELKLQGIDANHATYLAEFALPEGERQATVSVSEETGAVTWQLGPADETPAWLLKYAGTTLRTAWRARPKEPWPRRITRWRAEPDSTRRPSKPAEG